jgi:RNA polymerase sigma factor (sigma-70 family)
VVTSSSDIDPTVLWQTAGVPVDPPPEVDFDTFYRSNYRAVVGLLVLSGVSFENAQDCAQSAMFAAHRRWSDLSNPGAWVRRAATRLAVKTEQVDRRRYERALEIGPVIAHEAVTVPPEFTQLETAEWAADLFEQLPPAQQQVIKLWFAELTPAEIAEALGKTRGNVRSTLRHALEKLQQRLQPQHNDAGTPAHRKHLEDL